MEGTVYSFLKTVWRVSDTDLADWASSLIAPRYSLTSISKCSTGNMRQGYQEIYISLSNILEQTLFSQCNWTAREKYVQMKKG